MYHSYFAPTQSGLFPPQTHVGKLGNELALINSFISANELALMKLFQTKTF